MCELTHPSHEILLEEITLRSQHTIITLYLPLPIWALTHANTFVIYICIFMLYIILEY